MERITITLDGDLLAEIDAHMEASGATNRSEAIRDLIARSLTRDAPRDAQCLGVASYALDPAMRDLGLKVPKVRQDHHNRVAASLSVPVDHSTSVEVTVLQGQVREVERIANALFLERGVRHGRLTLVPLAEDGRAHSHGDGHLHKHLRVADHF
jgi:CopG family nickel-responsive transcriptional regulator